MPVVRGSRYARSLVIVGQDEVQRLTVPARVRGPRPDDITHAVRDGDTLESIAATYYAGLTSFPADLLYWAIGEYQDEPIMDPFLRLTAGSTLRLPSRNALQETAIGTRSSG
jgi:nucleoid-associated protein YgaU